jgi:large subunit ribosomal protein L31e
MKESYVIPLRKEFRKAPRYKQTSKAIRALKAFLKKHTKSDKIKIGKYLNEEMWKNGPKNPPAKIKVKIIKEGEFIKAKSINAPEEPKKEEKKKNIKKDIIEKKEVPKTIKKEINKEEKKVPTAKELAEKKDKPVRKA